jgi:uncharacterized protein
MYQAPTNDQLRHWLQETKTIAVVGLSDKPDRTSYLISETMQRRGYRIIPVNPMVTEVLGETSYGTLEDVPEQIDMVNVFRRSEELYSVVEAAIRVGAKRIWAQQGVEDERASELATANGIEIVMDQCLAVAHSVLMGGRS